jgi:adenylate cyclase, class 2
MTGVTEFEAKSLEVNPQGTAERIAEAGGVHVAERVMRRYVYDVRHGVAGKWIRLRDTGEEITLCVKEILSDAVDGVREIETAVADFDTTHALLESLGFAAKAYQENRRSSWLLGTVRLEIDAWPMIPPYLEIEGDSVEDVHHTAKLLDFAPETLTSENTTQVYRRYGIDLDAITDLRFTA